MNSTNIIKLLKSENDEIKSILSTMFVLKHNQAELLFLKVRAHMAIQEVVLFPEIQRNDSTGNDAVHMQLQNHQKINKFIDEIVLIPLIDKKHSSKVEELKEMIFDNIRSEEENIYPLLETTTLDFPLLETNLKNYKKRSNEIDGAHSI